MVVHASRRYDSTSWQKSGWVCRSEKGNCLESKNNFRPSFDPIGTVIGVVTKIFHPLDDDSRSLESSCWTAYLPNHKQKVRNVSAFGWCDRFYDARSAPSLFCSPGIVSILLFDGKVTVKLSVIGEFLFLSLKMHVYFNMLSIDEILKVLSLASWSNEAQEQASHSVPKIHLNPKRLLSMSPFYGLSSSILVRYFS